MGTIRATQLHQRHTTMGKLLRILVVLIAILGIVAAYFEYVNYSKREILIERTHSFEKAWIRLASTIEAEDAPETPQPSYPQRDTSSVTSRQLENPERSAFWESYNHKYEPAATSAPTLDYKSTAKQRQLRQLFHLDPVTGKPELDPLTGKPSTDGPDTMKAIFDETYERAQKQYSNLIATRQELPKLRDELIDVINELNDLKQTARADKKTIEERDARIAQLENEKADLEKRIERLNEELKEAQAQVAEAQEELEKTKEEMQTLEDRIKILQAENETLKGKIGGIGGANNAANFSLQPGVLTPGIKGEVIDFNMSWMFAIVKFDDAFMAELLGPQRDGALPQEELMVRRPDDKGGAFVTRIRLRQTIRDKNVVIADILSDWKQMDVQKGDVVYF